MVNPVNRKQFAYWEVHDDQNNKSSSQTNTGTQTFGEPPAPGFSFKRIKRTIHTSVCMFSKAGYCILFFEAKQFKKDGKKQTKKGPHILAVIPPGVMCNQLPAFEKGKMIEFETGFFDNTPIAKQCLSNRKLLQQNSVLVFSANASEAQSIDELIEAIAGESTCELQNAKEMMAIKLAELLIFCEELKLEISETPEPIEGHPIVQRFLKLLNQNYKIERSVAFYAEQLGIHPNHLNYLLKKETEVNAKETINMVAIQRAKQLLAQKEMIIKEVAFQLGFDDPNHFSTFFRKYVGISPAEFRAKST